MTVRIEHGDSLAVLPRLAAEGILVDAVITDAPYHLTSIVRRFGNDNAAEAKSGKTGAFKRASKGFMGKTWDGGDIAFRPEVWRGVYDVMKPGAHLIAFGGSRGYHRMACAIEDAGFEVRDSILDIIAADDPVRLFMSTLSQEQMGAFLRCIEDSQFGGLLAWIYGSGFPKSHNVSKAIDAAAGAVREALGVAGKSGSGRACMAGDFAGGEYMASAPATDAARQWDGWGTALKPAFEPIILARKPLSGTVAENVLAHGTGALNIDACRIHGDDAQGGSYTVKRLKPGATLDKTGGNWRPEDGPLYHGEMKAGRFPANIVHDDSAEVVNAFPDSDGAQGDVRGDEPSKPLGGGHIFSAMKGRVAQSVRNDAGSAARFFYSAKAESEDRLGSKHPTVKPVNLMRWLVRLVTPPGATVLDPFAGTGTTGAAAHVEGRHAILIEREAEYVEDIKRRLAFITGKAAHSGGVMKPVNDADKIAAAKGADLPLFGRPAA